MNPIYGHNDETTAYVVEDYPYGFKLRCKIRYWLEHVPSKGVRMCSQTTNPKKGNIWNKPVKSTYASIAGCMYTDEKGHVHWTGVHAYSTLADFQKFVELYPNAAGIGLAKEILKDLEGLKKRDV